MREFSSNGFSGILVSVATRNFKDDRNFFPVWKKRSTSGLGTGASARLRRRHPRRPRRTRRPRRRSRRPRRRPRARRRPRPRRRGPRPPIRTFFSLAFLRCGGSKESDKERRPEHFLFHVLFYAHIARKGNGQRENMEDNIDQMSILSTVSKNIFWNIGGDALTESELRRREMI